MRYTVQHTPALIGPNLCCLYCLITAILWYVQLVCVGTRLLVTIQAHTGCGREGVYGKCLQRKAVMLQGSLRPEIPAWQPARARPSCACAERTGPCKHVLTRTRAGERSSIEAHSHLLHRLALPLLYLAKLTIDCRAARCVLDAACHALLECLRQMQGDQICVWALRTRVCVSSTPALSTKFVSMMYVSTTQLA